MNAQMSYYVRTDLNGSIEQPPIIYRMQGFRGERWRDGGWVADAWIEVASSGWSSTDALVDWISEGRAVDLCPDIDTRANRHPGPHSSRD